MITLHFVGADGTTCSVTAEEGANVMELATHNAVPGISADCGGCLSCGTCHAYVAPEFLERLPPPGEMELAMLENLVDPRPASRLTCQLVVTRAIDGIRFDIPDAAF
jgi:2Fe-2S ferredoxin